MTVVIGARYKITSNTAGTFTGDLSAQGSGNLTFNTWVSDENESTATPLVITESSVIALNRIS